MLSNRRNSATTPGRGRITLAALAAMSMIAVLLLVSTTAQAQSGNGAIPNVRLSSASAGVLTISWDAPDPAPSDYRIIWAEQSLDFLSYKATNEANRGNEYPSGNETSITLTGLTKGETFEVRARTRYTSGGQNNGAWSGPWTDTVTTRVKDEPPAAPTGLTASQVAHDSVTLTWNDPEDTSITGYRVLRGTGANSLSAIVENTGSATAEYTDSTVAAETAYHYAVLALSADGDGAQSTPASATTPAEPGAPTASNGAVATNEDTDHAFAATDFNYSDSDGDTLASVKITELPAAGKGTLTLDGTAITSTDLPKTVTRAELDDGKLKYTPPANANGNDLASFRVKVNDGSVDSTDAYTMTIDVTAVNDEATGTPAITGDAQAGETLTASTSGIADADGLPSSFTYRWKRFSADGTTFEADIGTDSNAYTLTTSELDARVKVEVSFTDNGGGGEGPLVSAIFPSSGTVEASEEEVSSPGLSVVVETPSWTVAGTVGTVSADMAGLDVLEDPDGVEYTYRIDVLDSDGNDVDSCEGNGMGEALRIFEDYSAWVFVRLGSTEVREAQVSASCATGSYTARASIFDATDTEVVYASAEFEIIAQPPAPTGLTAARLAHDSVTLRWTDPQNASITGYRVLRGTDANSLSAIAEDTGSAGTEYTDSTVAAETTYFYAVLALSQNGNGTQSAAVSATTPAEPLSAATDDATLGSLSVAGAQLAEPFDAAVLDYTADAAAETTRVTVAAVAADNNACGVEISPADADDATTGHQVDLADNGAVVTVTVTAADCATTGTYTLTVSRGGTRPAAAARLSLQGVSDLSFDSGQRRYRIHTPRGATSTQVDADGADGATVEVFSIQAGQHKTPIGRDSALTRGAPSGTSVPLSQTAQTLVAVRVSTAGNERQSIYTVKLTPPPGQGSGAATRSNGTSEPRLSAFSVSPGTLTPTFAAATFDYTVDVAHTVEQLTVTATAATGTSVVIAAPDTDTAAGHQIVLNAAQPGGNAVQTAFLVIVTTDTNIESYTVTVTRAPPPLDGAALKALSLSAGTLAPAFAPSHTAYSAQVLPQDARVTVAASAAHSGATVATAPTDADTNTDGHQIDLTAGANTVTVTVTNGAATKTYTVTITRGVTSSDATLDALTLSEGALTPAFSTGTNSYTATVKPTTGQVTVAVTATVPAARVIISPPDADPDTAGHQINLAVPATTSVYIAVTATDGTTRNTYTVTITRPMSPTGPRLSALTATPGALTPVFAAETFEYTVAVGQATEHITIAATATISASAVIAAPDATPDTAGHQIALFAAPPGARPARTAFLVVVTQGATVESYSITVERAAPPSQDADLDALTLGAGALNPSFAPQRTSYRTELKAQQRTITVTAVAERSDAAVAITPADADPDTAGHQVNLAEGANTITITVTAADGATTKTYTVSVTRAPASTDATLTELTLSEERSTPAHATLADAPWIKLSTTQAKLSEVQLSPASDPDTNTYTAEVNHSIPEVTAAVTAAIGARVVVSPPDADPNKPGHQIRVAAPALGATTAATTSVFIAVTSNDDTTRNTYTVNVNRLPSPIQPITFQLPDHCQYRDLPEGNWTAYREWDINVVTEYCPTTYYAWRYGTKRAAEYYRLFVRETGEVSLRVDAPGYWSQNALAVYSTDGTLVAEDRSSRNSRYQASLTPTLERGVYVVEVARRYHSYASDDRRHRLGYWGDSFSDNIIRNADHRLESLAVGGSRVTDFDPDVTDYQISVATGVSTVTVTPTTAQPDAVIDYSLPDADTTTEGHQIALDSDGEAELTVSVTHPELTAFPFQYRITITQ